MNVQLCPSQQRAFDGLAVALERGAVVPSLFALPSQQPIRVAEPYRSALRPFSVAWYAASGDIDWAVATQAFDYVLLAAIEPPAVPSSLAAVATNGQFRLYRVVR